MASERNGGGVGASKQASEGGGGSAAAGVGTPASSAPAARRWPSRADDERPAAGTRTRREGRGETVEVVVELPRVLVEAFEGYATDASVDAGDRIEMADVLGGMLVEFMRKPRNSLAEEQRLEALLADWRSGELDVTRTRRHLLNPKSGR